MDSISKIINVRPSHVYLKTIWYLMSRSIFFFFESLIAALKVSSRSILGTKNQWVGMMTYLNRHAVVLRYKIPFILISIVKIYIHSMSTKKSINVLNFRKMNPKSMTTCTNSSMDFYQMKQGQVEVVVW